MYCIFVLPDNLFTSFFFQEARDSEVDEDMGNKHSKKSAPSVYYAPGYGVVLGDHPPSLDLDTDENIMKEEGIRLRPNKIRSRYKSPSPASDKDSAIGGLAGSEMSQSMYSENSAMRDSFYSTCTAESGFEDFYRSSGKGFDGFNPSSLRGSLPQLYKAHHGQDPGLNNITCSTKPGLETLSDVSSERSGVVSGSSHRGSSSSANSQIRTNVDPLIERLQGKTRSHHYSQTSDNSKSTASTVSQEPASDRMNPSLYSDPLGASQFVSAHSSPFNSSSVRQNSQQSGQSQQQFSPIRQRKRCEDTDLSQDFSESVSSFGSEEIDWDADIESESQMTQMPEFQQSVSDIHFQQSLMQRIHEWSTFAEEYNKSQVPSTSRESSPFTFVRRSKSLDRHLGDTSQILVSDCDISSPKPLEEEEEPVTEKNLETLEYELQDIQGEFESITSKLHELIEQGEAKAKGTPKSSKNSPSHRSSFPPAQRHKTSLNSPSSIRKMRTKWHVPSSACSDCSRSSRASSVEYAWDFADYVNNTGNTTTDSNMNSTGDQSRLEPATLDADNVFKNGKSSMNNIFLYALILFQIMRNLTLTKQYEAATFQNRTFVYVC